MTAGRWTARVSAVLLVLGTLMAVCAAAFAVGSPAYADSSSAARRLAEMYSPVVMLQDFHAGCEGDGEHFVPMQVDALLDNPEVALRQVGNRDAVIEWSTSARDLYGRGSGTYLDLPGDALAPGCVFADDSARYTPLSKSAVYAHVTTQADRPGYVAVQYWLYWYYNDWNDKHESDWEFVQVLFKAPTVQAALDTEPVEVGYAQHTGGETAAWHDEKLQKEGTHPVVYSSKGSHASYFEPALFLGRSASEGFGCDNTQAPNTRVAPRAVLLPDHPSGPDDEFAWLAFDGRWGERHGGPNNGPDGPLGKPRWKEPVTWEENLRPSSFVIPGGSETTHGVVHSFCVAVGKGSEIYIKFAAQPGAVLIGLVAVGLVLLFLLRRTRWDKVPAYPVVRRRRAGQLTRAAWNLYRHHVPACRVVGLLAIPVGLLAVLNVVVLQHLPFIGPALRVSTEQSTPGTRLLFSSWIATAFWPLTILLISGAVADLMDDGRSRLTMRRAWTAVRAVGTRWRELAWTYVPVAIVVVFLSWTGVGLPVAAWLTVRFQFLGQIVIREDLSGSAARMRSGRLVRHRWWHTAVVAAIVWAGVNALGVLLGVLVLVLFTSLPLGTITAIAMVVQVALTPLGAIALTLLYGDAAAQRQEDDSAREQRAAVDVQDLA